MEDEDEIGQEGALAALSGQLQELTDPSTTPEAQGYARRFLDKYEKDPYSKSQEALFTDLEKNTRAAQAALRAAREKLMARRYNPADAWYALAGALGSPTETGTLGEMFSNSAKALREPTQKKFEYGQAQDKEALALDTQSSGLEERLLALKLQQMGITRKGDVELAKEALKTLGRRTQGRATNTDKATQAVDREYAKDYVDWIQNGKPEADQALGELNSSLTQLKGYSVDAQGRKVPVSGGRNDSLTGPVVGSISTIPFGVGKWAQDVLFPKAANTQEQIESTVQRSLRPILGAQFTEKEGERLISRVYNPRLEEDVNAKRIEWLIRKLNVAAKNKDEAASWFRKHGSLAGFAPKHKFTIDDFMPDSTTPGEPGYEEGNLDNPDDDLPAIDPNEEVPPEEVAPPKRVRYRDLPKKKKQPLGFMGFAEGGTVPAGKMEVVMDDGSIVLADEGATQEDIDALAASPDAGNDDRSVARALFGAAAGAGAGLAGSRSSMRAATGLADMLPGRGETSAEGRLLRLMEKQNLTPDQVASNVRRSQRRGIPAMAMDVGPESFQSLAQTALPQGREQTQQLLDRLTARQAGSRERVNEQVNRGLKPDEYFGKEEELKKKLYGDKTTNPPTPSASSQAYEKAFAQFPNVRSGQLTALMDTPSGKKAVKAAMKTMQDKGVPIGKVNPVTGAVTKYSLEFLNQVKMEMDNLVGQSEKKGAMGKARDIKDLRTSFRNELDTSTTDPTSGESPYRQAREVNEMDRSHLKTLQLGREKFGQMQPQELTRAIAGMSFEEKDAFRTGVAQNIYETLNNPSTDINAARRLIGSPAMKAKLETMFDNPNEFRLFNEALEQEMKMFESSKPLLEQKPVIGRRAVEPRGSAVQRGAQKAPSLGIFSPTQWALRLIRAKPEMKDKEASELIEMLKSSTPEELTKFTSKLSGKFGRTASRKKMRGKVGMVGAGLGALAGALFEGQDSEAEETDPTLEGLSPEEQEWAKKPAMAKGGKVGALREMLEALKNTVEPGQREHMLMNAAVKTGIDPGEINRMLAPPIAERRAVPREPPATIALEALKRNIEMQRARMQQIEESMRVRDPRNRDRIEGVSPGYTPQELEHFTQNHLVANTALDRVQHEPTYNNYNRLEQLMRQLQDRVKKRHGGRMRRQFGGMTNHA